MTDIREHPPPATASAAPAAPAKAATRPGRVVGLDGIRGLAALFAGSTTSSTVPGRATPPITLRSGRPG